MKNLSARGCRVACGLSVALVAGSLSGCFEAGSGRSSRAAATNGGSIGHFRTRLAKPESETFEPAQCESGDRQAFLGVDLIPDGEGPWCGSWSIR